MQTIADRREMVPILTKKLGVGVLRAANRAGEASQEAMDAAVQSMTTLETNMHRKSVQTILSTPARM